MTFTHNIERRLRFFWRLAYLTNVYVIPYVLYSVFVTHETLLNDSFLSYLFFLFIIF